MRATAVSKAALGLTLSAALTQIVHAQTTITAPLISIFEQPATPSPPSIPTNPGGGAGPLSEPENPPPTFSNAVGPPPIVTQAAPTTTATPGGSVITAAPPASTVSLSAAYDYATLTPLVSRTVVWPDVPYQVTGDEGGPRGPQFGYNQCNETTAGPDSDCQTLFANSAFDFCLWSSSQPNDTIGASEAREVAWCTRPWHGSRVIPGGAISGLQLLYAKSYIQIVGYIDQTAINLASSDEGGELDPHGADGQGNPLGGVVFSNGFGEDAAGFQALVGGNSTLLYPPLLAPTAANDDNPANYTQSIEWTNFLGSDIFCLKVCNPAPQFTDSAPALCQHIYDEIGCAYNAPADYAAINGTYSVCDSDDMQPVGIYVGADGGTTTWQQPATEPFVVPYSASPAASSNCVTFSSEQLFMSASSTSTTASATSTGGSGPSGRGVGGASRTGASGAAQTASSGAGSSKVGGASMLPFGLAIAMGLAFF